MEELHNQISIGIDLIKSTIPLTSFNTTLQYKNKIIACQKTLINKIIQVSKKSEDSNMVRRNSISLGLNTTEDLITSITNLLDNSFYEDKQRLLDTVKKTYTLSYFNDTINKDIQHNNTIIKNELSNNAIEILEQINKKYFNIKESPDLEHNTIEIDNLYDKLPHIIKKFILIDKEYRHTLHNVEGKNAEALMIESLENINTKFDNFLITINESRLSSLSVSQRHTKAIKNSI